MAGQTRQPMWLIVVSVLLLLYALFLLLYTTSVSQKHLREAAQRSLRVELQKQAAVLGYFYSERTLGLARLARESFVTAFFSHRALGMSMEYGLKASLLAMQDGLRQNLTLSAWDSMPLYRRLLIQDEDGHILVDEGDAAGESGVFRLADEPCLERTRMLLAGDRVYLLASIRHRERPVACLIAEVDQAAVQQRLLADLTMTEGFRLEVRRADLALSDGVQPEIQILREPVVGTPFVLSYQGVYRADVGFIASPAYLYRLILLVIALLALLSYMLWQLLQRQRALACGRDQLAQANEQLQAQQRQLIDTEKMAFLAAGLAHEMNNPISFILGNLDILRDDQRVLIRLARDYQTLVAGRREREPELVTRWQQVLGETDLDELVQDLDDILMDMAAGGHRVADIVAGLRCFAQSEELGDTQFDLNVCLRQALQLAGSEMKNKVEVHIDLAPLPLIQGNPGQITRVLVNLLVNAAQAIERQGEVSIRTLAVDEVVQISIQDTGKGILPEDLKNIFTPFFTTKEVGAGVGLGLSISHSIVSRHGGRIEVLSRLGDGSKFSIFFPRARPADAHTLRG